jgi:hypothetical protein
LGVNTQGENMGNENVAQEKQPKLSAKVHLMCGWPLALVVIGGAIGGGLGGAAYGINVAIYKSRMPTPAKIALNILAGAFCFRYLGCHCGSDSK